MCGIAGFLGNTSQPSQVLREMSYSLVHRGPDDAGLWFDAGCEIGLAHRRLAILDLTSEGHQPMASASGRFQVVFNGEIYNFLELAGELRELGHSFRGHSDTEVMLACFEQWGVERSLTRLQGMFAIAVWDLASAQLTLARDRIGEKPLYYGVLDGCFVFGSELKALRRHPAFRGVLDAEALQSLFRYTYIPAPRTIYAGISKLSPGTFLQVSRDARGIRLLPHTYWSVVDSAAGEGNGRAEGSEEEFADQLEKMLSAVLSRQMLADVPLGAFLSGGVDSSTVVALMQAQSSLKVKTFSIGFHERSFNEAEHAKAVALHLGTDHTEFYVTDQDARDLVPQLPQIYDEPFADSSQIPTCLLTRLARGKVTVALSGDGGDELFFGYDRYRMVLECWRKFALAPHPLRRALAAMLAGHAQALHLLPTGGLTHFAHRVARFAELLSAESLQALNAKMTGYDGWAESLVPVKTGNRERLVQELWERVPDQADHMMLLDLLRYLPDDILVKVDRAAMATSLETRIPLLDHSLVEYVLRLPTEMKYLPGVSKRLLRAVLYRHVPKSLIERPKMGFGVPIEFWLRGPLREWGESLLSERALQRSGLFDPAPVRKKWQEHQSGRCNWRYQLWPVLMFQSWLEAYH